MTTERNMLSEHTKAWVRGMRHLSTKEMADTIEAASLRIGRQYTPYGREMLEKDIEAVKNEGSAGR